MYVQAVMLSYKLGEAISERMVLLPESTSPDPKAYPPCQFQWYELNGSPVYQFDYEGMLPLYVENRAYQKQIRAYYNRVTMEALMDKFRFKQPEAFDQAIIYMCHYFGDLRIRDLDNRNRSHLINAIRSTRIIEDDCWKKISTMESGFLDPLRKSHIKMYVADRNNVLNLIEYVNSEVEKES
ncbi:hypothetical protein D3C81_1416390 [compost metagenome]